MKQAACHVSIFAAHKGNIREMPRVLIKKPKWIKHVYNDLREGIPVIQTELTDLASLLTPI